MYDPKSFGEEFRRLPDLEREPGERRPPAEPRSFAPRRAVRGPGWSARAIWPPDWAEIAPEAFIRAPREALGPDTGLAVEPAHDRVLIVVPCLNEAAGIARLIARLLDDDGLADPLLLVADGGSTDGSREIVAAIAARDRRVRLLANPGRLQSAGVNLAVRAMGGGRPWLVRVDAHADYPRGYVSRLIAEARRTGADSVVVAMETRGHTPFQRAAAAAQNSRLGTGGAAHRLGARAGWVDHGHHALFSREAFEAVGGYDESFSHNEDAEFDVRLSGEGGRIWLTDRTRIIYHPRRTSGALWRQYFIYGKGRARTALKHRTRLKPRQAAPLAVAPAVLALGFTPLFWPLAAPAVLWAAAATAYGAALGLRARDPAVLMAGPAAMIMHFAWSSGFWIQLARTLAARPPGPQRPVPAVVRIS
jgi:succinoglycan biosynthesis protein ExoA